MWCQSITGWHPSMCSPAALDDAYAATRWVADHAAELNCDASQLMVAGDGTGGNLAIDLHLRAKGMAGRVLRSCCSTGLANSRMDAPSHALYAQMPILTREAMAAMWRHYHPGVPAHPLASIMQYPDVAALPPAVLVTADWTFCAMKAKALPSVCSRRACRFQPCAQRECCMALPTSVRRCRQWRLLEGACSKLPKQRKDCGLESIFGNCKCVQLCL